MSWTITDVAPRVHYTATADQTTFTVPFRFANTELKVYVNGVLKTYDVTPANADEYSTTGENAEAGGTIVFGGTGRALGDLVVILRDLPVLRASDFQLTGAFPIDALNTELFRLTAMIQQVETKLDARGLRLSDTDQPLSIAPIPDKATRAGSLLGFDANGDPTATTTTPTIEAAEDAAVNAAASASASATAASNSATNAGNSAAAASTSATNAGNSATAASTSATNAANSAADAAASAAIAADPIPTGGTAGQFIIKQSATDFDIAWGNIQISHVTSLQASLDAKAPLASPALTGTPTAPTAAGGSNTSQIATTAFVTAAIDTIKAGVAAAGDTLLELYNLITGHTNNTSNPHSVTAAQVGLGTTDSPQFAAVNIGHATDTTLARGAAGFLSVEGKRLPSPASQASGDILYRGATEWERLAKGTAGQVLTMNAGASAPEWAAAAGGGVPVGTVVSYAGASAPTGWLLCFGQAVSRTTYSELFTAISTTYGVGDGSTTFNLPDLRGRVVAGQDDMGGVSANRLTNQTGGLDGDVLGATGGAETHTLTAAQMQHTHSASTNNSTAGSVDLVEDNDTINSVTASAHNNVQPTIILNSIIFANA